MRGELLGNLVQPFIELRLRPRIERGKRADHTCLALRNDEFRPGHDEQGRAYHRQAKCVKYGG